MPHDTDIHIGLKARELRLSHNLSQAGLAKHLGMSFQQVQKYETGMNRISARRLYDICQIFGVSSEYFYEDLRSGKPPAAVSSYRASILRTAARLEKLDPDVRQNIRDLILTLAVAD